MLENETVRKVAITVIVGLIALGTLYGWNVGGLQDTLDLWKDTPPAIEQPVE
jgi:hypothetical protein